MTAFLLQPADHAIVVLDVCGNDLAEAHKVVIGNLHDAGTLHDMQWWSDVAQALSPEKAKRA
jgi:hypothetical protein